MKKWDGHRKKKLFINNSVEDLGPFKEEYQGLLKLHVLFFWEGDSSVGEKWGYLQKENFL